MGAAVSLPHVVLLIAAAVMTLESLWGLVKPADVKKNIGDILPNIPPRQPGTGIFFLAVAVVLWMAVPDTLALSSWLLLVVVLFTATMGVACLRENSFRHLAELLIVNRSPGTIRLIYSAELLLAGVMIWAGLTGH